MFGRVSPIFWSRLSDLCGRIYRLSGPSGVLYTIVYSGVCDQRCHFTVATWSIVRDHFGQSNLTKTGWSVVRK